MTSSILPYSRINQVLTTFHENGCLSQNGLQKLIEPKMSKRSLQYVIKRLLTRKLIVKRNDSLLGNVSNFYQLSQTLDARNEIAKILFIHPEALWQPSIRNQELFHSEDCAFFIHHFKNIFPSAQVIRDFNFTDHPKISKILISGYNDREIRPDIILHFPNTPIQEEIFIAVEIEKTRKSNERLFRKLTKLCSGSLLDGVIYISTSENILDVLRHTYSTKILENDRRIKHYASKFLMFSDGNFNSQSDDLKMFNSELEGVSLKTWTHFLCTTKKHLRGDKNYQPHS